MQENDVTPSYVMQMKGDSPNKSKVRHASPCSDLLQNNSRQFSIATMGRLCLNRCFNMFNIIHNNVL